MQQGAVHKDFSKNSLTNSMSSQGMTYSSSNPSLKQGAVHQDVSKSSLINSMSGQGMSYSSSNPSLLSRMPAHQAATGGSGDGMTSSSSNPSLLSRMPAHQAATGGIIALVRKQVEVVEERFGRQLVLCREHSDLVIDAAVRRFEEKIRSLDEGRPKLERQISELSGSVSGLTLELQSQMGRGEALDKRLWDWRRRLEVDLRDGLADVRHQLEQHFEHRVTSTPEQLAPRLAKLERLLETEGGFEREELPGGIFGLMDRLEALEVEALQDRNRGGAVEVGHTAIHASDAVLMACERRLADTIGKVDRIAGDVVESQSRAEEHGARLVALRSRLDAQDQRHADMGQRIESSDMSNHVEQIRQAVQRQGNRHGDSNERLEIFSRRLEDLEASHLELEQEARGEHKRLLCTLAGPARSKPVTNGRLPPTSATSHINDELDQDV